MDDDTDAKSYWSESQNMHYAAEWPLLVLYFLYIIIGLLLLALLCNKHFFMLYLVQARLQINMLYTDGW